MSSIAQGRERKGGATGISGPLFDILIGHSDEALVLQPHQPCESNGGRRQTTAGCAPDGENMPTYKTARIKIERDEVVGIYIRKDNRVCLHYSSNGSGPEQTKINTGLNLNLKIVGPATICLAKSKRK